MLWAVDGDSVDPAGEMPDESAGVRAVVSSVKRSVLRFTAETAEPLGDTLLVSTVAVGGPATFVVQKSHQGGTTIVCDAPSDVYVVERRYLFRVPVAAPVTVKAPEGTWSLYTLDCSLGGLCICPPKPLEVDSEVDVNLQLGSAVVSLRAVVSLHAVVRHSRPFCVAANCPQLECDACPSVTGLQFLEVPSDVERQLDTFIGRHQRRLMPRVQAVVPVEYRSKDRKYFIETGTRELSPGDMVLMVHQAYLPGDRMELKLRLNRQDFVFQACVITCHSTGDEREHQYNVKVSIDDVDDALEAQFRKAVRDLAVERVGSRYSA
jgi:c-di-GMP-binding flagellar brake protein YcgR